MRRLDVTLALGGGGIKGIAHIGVIKVLLRHGYTVRAIAGTSAGGLVGAIFAAGYTPEEIGIFLSEMDQGRMFHRMAQDKQSLLGLQGWVEKLAEILGEAEFKDLKIPFVCTAVDINTYQEVTLSEGKVIDSILATIAVPGIFPPRQLGNRLLVDGGVLNPVPVSLARSFFPALPVIAVCLSGELSQSNQPPTLQLPPPLPVPTPLIEQFSRLRLAQAFNIFIRSIDATSRTLTELRLKNEKPDVIIRPNLEKFGLFDQVQPESLIDLGEKAAEDAIPAIQKSFSGRKWLIRYIRSI